MKPEHLGGELFTPRILESIQLKTGLIERSLDNNRWATPQGLNQANHTIQTAGNPLLERLKDQLGPFVRKPLGYSDGLNHAFDEERRAAGLLGINQEYTAIKDRVGDTIGNKIREAMQGSFWNNGVHSPILPSEVYEELQRMIEVTERCISWNVTSQTPGLKGLPNPFEQFVHLYMRGVVKIKFVTNPWGTQWINAHIPLKSPRRNTLLGCWTEMEEEISGTHGWNEDCKRKRDIPQDIAL